MKKIILLALLVLACTILLKKANAQIPNLNVTFPGNGTFVMNTGDQRAWTIKLDNTGGAAMGPIYINLHDPNITNYVTFTGYIVSTQQSSPVLCNSNLPGFHNWNSEDTIRIVSLAANSDKYIHICVTARCSIPTFTQGWVTATCGPDIQSLQSNLTVYSGGIPEITVEAVNNETPLFPLNNSSFCGQGAGNSTTLSFRYTNNGVVHAQGGAAYSKMIDLGVYIAINDQFGSVANNSFKISDGSINPINIPFTVYSATQMNGFTVYNLHFYDSWIGTTPTPYQNLLVPNTQKSLCDLDGDEKMDDLNGQESFVISFEFNYNTGCPFTDPTMNEWSIVTTFAYFQNQCKTLSANLNTGDVNYCLNAWDETLDDTPGTFFQHTGSFDGNDYSPSVLKDASIKYTAKGSGSTVTAPADVQETTAFNFNICPGYEQTWSPLDFDFNCPEGIHRIKVPMPAGYHLNIPCSTVVNPPMKIGTLPVTINGDPIPHIADVTEIAGICSGASYSEGYIYIDIHNIPRVPSNSTTSASASIGCINLPLLFDCDCSPTPPTTNPFSDDLKYTMEFICCPQDLPLTNNCSNRLGGALTSTTHHCTDICTEFGGVFQTYNGNYGHAPLVFERTTLGWTNPDPNSTLSPHSYNASTLGPVNVPNVPNNIIKLNRAYPGDAIAFKVEGYFGGDPANFSSLFLQLKYDNIFAPPNSHNEIFDLDPNVPSFITAKSKNNAAAIHTFTATDLVYEYIPGDLSEPNMIRVKINPSDSWFTTTVSSNGIGFIFSAEIHLVVRSRANGTFGTSQTYFPHGRYHLNHLRAEYAGYNNSIPATLYTSCDDWGAEFSILQPLISQSLALRGPITSSASFDCRNLQAELVFECWQAMRIYDGIDFPYEFRPYLDLDENITLNFPAGFTLKSVSFIMPLSSYDFSNNIVPGAGINDNYFNGNTSSYSNPIPITGWTVTGNNSVTINPLSVTGTNHWPLVDYKKGPTQNHMVFYFIFEPDCDASDVPIDGFSASYGFTEAFLSENIQPTNHVGPLATGNIVAFQHNSPGVQIPTTSITTVDDNNNGGPSKIVSNELELCANKIPINNPILHLGTLLASISPHGKLIPYDCSTHTPLSPIGIPQTFPGSGEFIIPMSSGSNNCVCYVFSGLIEVDECLVSGLDLSNIPITVTYEYSCQVNGEICPITAVSILEFNFIDAIWVTNANPIVSLGISGSNLQALTICSGDPNPITLIATGGSSNSSYSWYSNNVLIPGNITNSMTLNPTPTSNNTYHVIVSAGACTLPVPQTNNVTITVNPLPAMPGVTTPVHMCQGVNFNGALLELNVNHLANHTLLWYTSQNSSATIHPTSVSTAIGGSTFNYFVTQTDPSGCESLKKQIDLVIDPAPLMNIVQSLTYCHGTQTSPITLSNPANASYLYTWTVNNNSIGLTAGSGLVIPSFFAINTTNTVQIATVTVTPYINPPSGCSGVPITFTITVFPIPSMSHSDEYFCPSSSLLPITFGTSGLVSFDWTNNNLQTGILYNGTGNIAFYPTNFSNSSITSHIIVTPKIYGCSGTAVPFDVVVYPTPTVTNSNLAQSICSGGHAMLTPTSDVAGTTFTYSSSVSSGNVSGNTSLTTGGTSGIINDVLINSGTVPETVTYVITPAGPTPLHCFGTPKTFVVTVNPLPGTSNAGPDQNITSSSTNLAGNFASPNIGTWTLISGSGNIISPSTNTTLVTNLGYGANVFEWTISNDLCPPTKDQVTINYKCSPTGDPLHPEYDLNSTSNTQTWTGNTYYATSNSPILFSNSGGGQQTLIFSKCHFLMATGSSLIVNPNVTLVFSECILEGCPDSWNGIVAKSGSIVNFSNSLVKNAKTAVWYEQGATYDHITSSVFNQNKRDVYIEGYGNNNNSIAYGTISKSVFTCRYLNPTPSIGGTLSTLANDIKANPTTYISSPLLYFPIPTSSSLRSETGIEINEVGTASTNQPYTIKIGNAGAGYSSDGNLFDRHDFGIKINESNTEVVNCRFQEMQGYTKITNSTGIGIYAQAVETHKIKIGSNATNEKNSFIDCGTGSYIKNYVDVFIESNDFLKSAGTGSPFGNSNYSGRMGIKMVSNKLCLVSCNSNTIQNIHTGIDFDHISNWEIHALFNDNQFIIQQNEISDVGIFLHSKIAYHNFNSDIEIKNNNIQNLSNGIRVENFRTTNSFSIIQNPNIIIKRNNPIAKPQSGIYIYNSDKLLIADNPNIEVLPSINNNVTGIYLFNSQNSEVNCNKIKKARTGIRIQGVCSSPPNSEGLLHKNEISDYFNGVDLLKYASISTQGTASHGSDNIWLNPNTGGVGIRNQSGTNPVVYIHSGGPNSISPFGSVTMMPATGASSTTCLSSTPFSPIVSNQLTNEEYEIIRKLLGNELNFPVLAEETKWNYGSILYEKILNDSTINPNDSIISNFVDSLALGNVGKFYVVSSSIKNGDWNLAESDNQSIVTQSHIEANLKKYNNYYIAFQKDTSLGGDSTWLANMINDLTPIAEECILTGGSAVSGARTMLSYFTPNIYPSIDECLQSPADSIGPESSNTLCALIKTYSVSATTGATYTWTVPSGTSFTQSGNSISVNWGSVIGTGGTITCTIMDALGNTSTGSYTQAPLVSNPTCITTSANNTSCVTATQLSWNPPAGCAAGYLIMLGTNGSGTATPDNVVNGWDVGNVTSVTLPMLSGGTTYYFQVIPYDDAHVPVNGCSIFSFTSGNGVDFTPTLGNPYIENFDGVSPPELPCGITISDENFPRDGVVWATSAAASCSGNNSIAISKNPNNTTAKDDWFYSAPLNLTAGELYQVDFNAKTDGPQTEGFEAYIGSSPDAATMQSNSSIINSYISNSTCVNTLASDYIATYTGQFYVGVHANQNPNGQTLFVDDLRVSLIPTVKISTETCGATLSSCDRIQCDLINGATSYKFRIENLQLGFSMEYAVNSNNPLISEFYNAPVLPLPLGETYTVSATAFVNGNWMPFGASCTITINAQTTVTATDVSGCAGSAISLSGSPSGGTFSISNPYTGPSASYTYTFTDEYGCAVTSAPANITVNALPTVSAANVSGCEGTAISLSGSPAGGSWSVANPYTGPSSSYTYSYTDGNGCSNSSSSASITVNELPTVTAANVSGCVGASIALSGSPSGGTWSVANPYTGSSTTYTHTYTDENGCSSTSSAAAITVNALPTVTASAVIGCAETAIALSGTPAGGTWSVANPYTGASTTYTHSYTDANGCSNTSASATITVTSCPKLNTTTCNTASFNMCDRLAITTVSGATAYKYKFENTSLGFSQEYTPASLSYNPYMYQFLNATSTSIIPGYTYAVSVAALVNGSWTYYGPTCNVVVNPIPITSLNSASCNINLPSMNTYFYTNNTGICGIYDYKYEFTEGNTTFEVNRGLTLNNYIMIWIPSPNQAKYSTTYSVRVKLKMGNTWGDYGPSCTITTPPSPLTQLQTAFCGYTLPLFSSLVNCDAVPGAIDYKYHITGPSNYNKTFNRNQAGNDWHFSWTILGGGQQNMVPNTTYAVEVASNAGGVWSAYGASCNITTPATQWREAEAFELNQNSLLNEATDELALLVYPNPNAINNEFFIEVRGIHTAGEAAQITIYDLVGKLIYKETATYNEGDTQLRVKPSVRPAQGVYMIEAIVKGKKLRQKFVVD